jgi:uncharacterized membrane protein
VLETTRFSVLSLSRYHDFALSFVRDPQPIGRKSFRAVMWEDFNVDKMTFVCFLSAVSSWKWSWGKSESGAEDCLSCFVFVA